MSHEDPEYVEKFLFKHKGIYFNKGFTTPEWIDSLENLKTRDSDVFLVTYPKSGTIWTQQILSLIFSEGHLKGTEDINIFTRLPWIEYNLDNVDFDARPSPRLFTSHLPYNLMPKDLRNRRGKIIYVCRNPKDVMVSSYHFHKMFSHRNIQISWEEFVELFIHGKVFAGFWCDHIQGWYTNQEDFNILFMTYEEMKKDLRSAIMKICSFVDRNLDDETLNIIVEKATFKNMKHDPLANYTFMAEDLLDTKNGHFLRKGAVGDWKNTMTVAQNELFDRVFKEKMEDLPIKFIWNIDENN